MAEIVSFLGDSTSCQNCGGHQDVPTIVFCGGDEDNPPLLGLCALCLADLVQNATGWKVRKLWERWIAISAFSAELRQARVRGARRDAGRED